MRISSNLLVDEARRIWERESSQLSLTFGLSDHLVLQPRPVNSDNAGCVCCVPGEVQEV